MALQKFFSRRCLNERSDLSGHYGVYGLRLYGWLVACSHLQNFENFIGFQKFQNKNVY